MVVGRDIFRAVGPREEAMKGLVIGQIPRRAQFEAIERDMRAVEVDRGDAGGIGGQIAHHIAAAGGDGDDMIVRTDRQRLHVDDRILPDLRIDQSLEREGEQAFEQAGAGKCRVSMDSGAETGRRRAIGRAQLCAHRQVVLPAPESGGPLQSGAR